MVVKGGNQERESALEQCKSLLNLAHLDSHYRNLVQRRCYVSVLRPVSLLVNLQHTL